MSRSQGPKQAVCHLPAMECDKKLRHGSCRSPTQALAFWEAGGRCLTQTGLQGVQALPPLLHDPVLTSSAGRLM